MKAIPHNGHDHDLHAAMNIIFAPWIPPEPRAWEIAHRAVDDYLDDAPVEILYTPDVLDAFIELEASRGVRAGALYAKIENQRVANELKASVWRRRVERQNAAGTAWGRPVDVFRRFEAPPFTVEDVPEEIGVYATAWAQAGGFDPSGAIVAATVAAASMIDDSIRVRLPRSSDWYESARLWALLIAFPSAGKTPSIRAVTRPVTELHRELVNKYDADNPADGKERDDAPPRPALFTSDTTIEKMADILRANPRGILYLNDEFETWVGSHDAYRGGGASRDTGEWLRLYEGGPKQIDRVKRGSSFVQNWGASVLSATTPATLTKLAKRLPNDGLLQRFIVVCMGRRTEPASWDREFVHQCQGTFDDLLHTLYGMEGPSVVQMSNAAVQMFNVEATGLLRATEAVEGTSESFASHVGKHTAMLARVALTFHCAQNGEKALQGPIEAATMDLAIRFMRRAWTHSWAVYGAIDGISPAIEIARDVARRILAAGATTIERRDLVQTVKSWRAADDRLRDAAAVHLVDCGWWRALDGERNRQHTTRWEVNPLVNEMFSTMAVAERERRAAVRQRMAESRSERDPQETPA